MWQALQSTSELPCSVEKPCPGIALVLHPVDVWQPAQLSLPKL
jgi:hypothetical protein